MRARRWIALALLALALAAAAALAWRHHAARAEPRHLEARVGWAPLDRYRPFAAAVAAGRPHAQLAELERRGDLHAVAALCLERNDKSCAASYLERAAGDAPDLALDRSVLALVDGRAADAVEAQDRLLAARPPLDARLANATRWDRALALHDLGLPLAAAEAFAEVAAAGESGWAGEARERATALRAAYDAEKRAWSDTAAAGRRLMLDGTLPPAALVEAQPIAMRYWFNHAVRGAPSRTAALALLPLAERLDRETNAHVLRDEVGRVANADFAIRAPLAARYRELIAGAHPPPADEAERFLERLRHAGARDLLVSAIPAVGRMRADLAELLSAAATLGDPWYEVMAAEETAATANAAGDAPTAERRLVDARDRCLAAHVDYRCVPIELDLATLLNGLHRTSEAMAVGRAALVRARRHAPLYSARALFAVADIARFRNSFSLMRAFLREGELRAGDNCQVRCYVHERRAAERGFALDATAAQAELAAGPRCGQPITQLRADLLADLERMGAPLAESATLLADLTVVAPARSPGERALDQVFAGRYVAVHDPAAGVARLTEALAVATKLDDADARKAQTMALLSLAMESARAGRFGDTLDWLARPSGRPAGSCVLGVAVDAERQVTAARARDGAVIGRFVARRAAAELVPAELVPAEIARTLATCPTVDVLALPPVEGLPRLLGRDVAWSYRAAPAAVSAAPTPSLRLVVSGVEAPARLGLPRLAPWTPTRDSDQIWLTSFDATPARVVERLRHATEVVFHVHGLVDLGVSDVSMLVLSPGSDGAWALTARSLARERLLGRPIVILGACHAAETAPYLHEAWGLPLAFLRAGARAVIASPASLPDREAGALFSALLARIRGGQDPAVALRDERARSGAAWADELLLFQ